MMDKERFLQYASRVRGLIQEEAMRAWAAQLQDPTVQVGASDATNPCVEVMVGMRRLTIVWQRRIFPWR